MMLRATSEMAVAMSVWSVPEKPQLAASSRPFWRASTMSCSCSMATRTSASSSAPRAAPRWEQAEHLHAFLEIERGGGAVEGEAELDHGDGDVGLDAHDHRTRAAQAGGVGDAADG